MAVFFLDRRKKSLMPTSEKRARLLLELGRATVVNLYPFTIRLKDLIQGQTQSIWIKIDPGSKSTGLAVVREKEVIHTEVGETRNETTVLNLFQINHRRQAISAKLTSRRQIQLMLEAEKIGKERNALFATVNTIDWEALPFYQKLGYDVEFTREGYEKKSKMFFLRKSL